MLLAAQIDSRHLRPYYGQPLNSLSARSTITATTVLRHLLLRLSEHDCPGRPYADSGLGECC